LGNLRGWMQTYHLRGTTLLLEVRVMMAGGKEIGFNENSENPDSIDRFLVLPQKGFLVHAPLPTTVHPELTTARAIFSHLTSL
jgi:hypothetical protein